MNNETKVMNDIQVNFIELEKHSRIYRNNVGQGWQGKVHHVTKPKQAMPGDIIIRFPRILNAGLCHGSSDLIGWTSKIITPDMVGKRVAIFTALEVKMPGEKLDKHQKVFDTVVRDNGGVSGLVTSFEDVKALVNGII
jgi:hypothetical protein